MTTTEQLPPQFDLTQRDIADICSTTEIGEYVAVTDDGVRFRDLVTHELLVPGGIPPAVALHPTVGLGYRYLQNRGEQGNLTVQLVLANHGSAYDFLHTQEMHALPFSLPFLGVEADWSPNTNGNAPSPETVASEITQAPGRREFQAAQRAWAQVRDKQLLPCELPRNDDSELARQLTHLWDNIFIPITTDKNLDPAQKNAMSIMAERTYQATRQNVILGQFGKWLLELDKTHNLLQTQPAPLMLGSWHGPSATRLNNIGVRTEIFRGKRSKFDEGQWQQYGALVMQSVYEGRASLKLLNTPKPTK